MTEDKALFILKVIALSSNYHERNECDDMVAVKEAHKISKRYSVLKRSLGFEEAAIQSKKEFLMTCNANY
jgi:hypothetical protein